MIEVAGIQVCGTETHRFAAVELHRDGAALEARLLRAAKPLRTVADHLATRA
jgi:hypothetical protein